MVVVADLIGSKRVMAYVAGLFKLIGCFIILCQVHGYRVVKDSGDLFFTFPSVYKGFNNLLASIPDRIQAILGMSTYHSITKSWWFVDSRGVSVWRIRIWHAAIHLGCEALKVRIHYKRDSLLMHSFFNINHLFCSSTTLILLGPWGWQ